MTAEKKIEKLRYGVPARAAVRHPSDDPDDNPNLDFALADTAAVIGELRAEGHQVLVHCVRAEQRTPSVALVYAVRLGATPEQAREVVAKALPRSRQRGRLWDQAAAVGRNQ